MTFVCPRCKGALGKTPHSYGCDPCTAEYPIVCGIADFRLWPDPYIGIPEDRRKGELLHAFAEQHGFEAVLRYYYSITPEVPPHHAKRWIAHSLAQVEIARSVLGDAGVTDEGDAGAALLDIGCSTGGLLAAAAGTFARLTGADVAFRWLVVGRARLRELGVTAELVCANAEALPFPDRSFNVVTAIDVLEHFRDPKAALRESARVSARHGRTFCATNNRYAPLPDPQVGLWGVGYVPRRWQPAFVARRRAGLHIYEVRMRSATEVRRLFADAGFTRFRTKPAPLYAPHATPSIQRVLRVYNRCRDLPLIRLPLCLIGPRLMTLAER
jgi:ubiquinone/menaquinone biosynthesis C-methylase UbiE